MHNMLKNFALGLLVAGAVVAVAAFNDESPARAQSGSKSVVELFTSQGCSSCPPADALLEKYAARDDVIALSLPVDYWDYLGWKDTLASPAYSKRQRDYARTRGDSQVYTPQVVVNGVAHAVGSDKRTIDRQISRTIKRQARVPVRLRPDGEKVVIETGAAPDGLGNASGTIWLALVKKSEKVTIQRGENRGRKITYFNVVRELKPIGEWRGKATTLKVAKMDLKRFGADGCVVLLQQGKTGRILGVAEMEDLRGI
ncbi:MAG: DUF1223 domain-containing protein [Methyloligellaceae bacterium]